MDKKEYKIRDKRVGKQPISCLFPISVADCLLGLFILP